MLIHVQILSKLPNFLPARFCGTNFLIFMTGLCCVVTICWKTWKSHGIKSGLLKNVADLGKSYENIMNLLTESNNVGFLFQFLSSQQVKPRSAICCCCLALLCCLLFRAVTGKCRAVLHFFSRVVI